MRHNRQLALLRLGRHTLDTHHIAAAKQVVRLKVVALLVVLHLCHDLDLDALSVQVVETQLLARRTHVVQTAGHGYDIRKLRARLNLVLVLRNKVRQTDRHMELVRVRIRLAGLTQLLDRTAPHLVVLVRRKGIFSCQVRTSLGRRSITLLLHLGRLLSLLTLLLPLLLSALELALANHLARLRVSQQIHGRFSFCHRTTLKKKRSGRKYWAQKGSSQKSLSPN